MSTQKLTVFTNADHVNGNHVEIHAHGCADTKKQVYKIAERIENGEAEWASKQAWAADYWSDINAEQNGPDYDWTDSELHWNGCVTLPDTEEENEMAKTDTGTGKTDADKGAEKAAAKEAKKLPGKAPGTVPAPRSASSKALPGGLCRCGCGTAVGRTSTFAQGHDARFVSKLVQKFEKGEASREEVLTETGAISEPLKAKAEKALTNAVANVKKREDAKVQKEAKAAERAKAAEAAKAKAAAAKAEKEAAAKEAADKAEALTQTDDDLDEVKTPTSGVEDDDDF